jgi:hypothetical protein
MTGRTTTRPDGTDPAAATSSAQHVTGQHVTTMSVALADPAAGPFGVVLGRQPGRDRPGQRRDWHAVRAALERLAEQRERLGRGDRQDQAGHRDRDRGHLQDRDRHERDGR